METVCQVEVGCLLCETAACVLRNPNLATLHSVAGVLGWEFCQTVGSRSWLGGGELLWSPSSALQKSAGLSAAESRSLTARQPDRQNQVFTSVDSGPASQLPAGLHVSGLSQPSTAEKLWGKAAHSIRPCVSQRIRAPLPPPPNQNHSAAIQRLRHRVAVNEHARFVMYDKFGFQGLALKILYHS